MIKLVLFDLGGVIIDFTNDEHYYPYLAKASKAGVKRVRRLLKATTLWEKLDKDEITQQEFDRKISKELRIREKDVKWYEMYKKEARVDKRVLAIAKKLSKNYKVGYLSNVDQSRYTWTRGLLKSYSDIFAYKFASCDIHRRKPDCEIYLYVLQRMKIKPSEAVFIDNLKANVVGARKAGLKGIVFKNSSDLKRQLKKLGVSL